MEANVQNPFQTGLDHIMAPLVGGKVESVRKHRLTIRCTDGIVRIAGLQADSEGNGPADVFGRIPMFKGARRGSLAALAGMVIVSAQTKAEDDGTGWVETIPVMEFTFEGVSERFSVEVASKRGGGWVHVWTKGKKAPTSAL